MSTNPQPLNFDDLGAKPVPVSPASGSLDFSDLGAQQVSTPDTNTATQQPLTDEQIAQRSDAFKRQVYSQAHSDFSAGNYRKAASDLLSLFHNPDEQDIQDVGTGIVKGAGQTVNSVSNVVSKVAPSIVRPQDVKTLEQIETPNNAAQKVGAGFEGIAEFMLGDEALKALSVGDRLLKAGKLAKMIEESPRLKRAVEIGMNAFRTGTVGTAQGLAHGESLPGAAASGAIAGGTGAVLDTAAEGVKALAPSVEKIAGEAIPVRGSQDSKIAEAAENVAPSKTLQKFDVEQTQPAAKRAVGNVATEVKNAAVQKMGSDTKDFQQAVKETGKPVSDLSTSELSNVASRAQELKMARNGLPPASDLKDAADSVRSQSKPVFEKLDSLTKNEDMKFSDWQQQERGAFRRGDIEAAQKAKVAQQAILDKFKNQFDPQDLENARTNWRQASALDDVHDTLNSKSVVQPTPIKFRATGTPDPGYISGKGFSKEILKLANDGTLQQAGLTPEHIQSLQDLGTLLEKSGAVQQPDLLTKAFKATKVFTGAATAGGGYVASAGLGRIMTNPETAAKVLKFAQAAAKVAPGAAAQIYQGASGALSGAKSDEVQKNP